MKSYRAHPPNGSGERLPRIASRFVQDCRVAAFHLLEFISPLGPSLFGPWVSTNGSTCRPLQSDDAVRHVSDRDIAPCCGIVGLMLNAMMDQSYLKVASLSVATGCVRTLFGTSGRYHHLMPDTTEEVHEGSNAMPTAQTIWQRWLAPAALLVAVVAVALAIWALMSASSNASAGGKQPGDPKMRVCTAFDTVSKAVTAQTHNDLGPDPVAQAAVAGNARLALLGGGQYLLSRLDSATPTELADHVRSFANGLQEIGIYALAGVPNTEHEQAARLTEADLTRTQIVDLCK
jgi:hypothetical protein